MYAYFYTNFTLDYPTYCSSETKNATLLSTFSDDGRAQIQSACSKSEMLCGRLSLPFAGTLFSFEARRCLEDVGMS